MKIIRPTAVTDAMLTGSTLLENEFPAWNAATAYSIGDKVIRATTHSIYQRLVAGTTPTTPELDIVKWVRIGPTNRWAMFDQSISTASTAFSTMTMVIAAGRVNSLALLGLDAATVTVAMVAGGSTVYSASINLVSGINVGNWYQYFYEPIYQRTDLVITNLMDAALLDIPAYGDGVITITIARPLSTVSCGVLILGLYADLGVTLNQPTIGITDYSRKETDAYGTTVITRRNYSKRMSVVSKVDKSAVDNVANLMAQYRSTPLVWVASDDDYASLIVYGFYRDWGLTIDSATYSKLNIEIEGLT